MQLVRPDISALQMLRCIGQRLVHVTFIDQLAWRGWVAANRVFGVRHIGHAWPWLPNDLEFAHGLLGVFLAFSHDAHKIALHHHRSNTGQMGNRLCVHALECLTNEVTAVSASVRRANHPTMQHARQTHVMHEHQFTKHLARYVDSRQALTRHGVCVHRFERCVQVQLQLNT